MKASPFRRKLVVVVLLGLAITGAAIRYWADNPSTLRDLGSLLLVMWLPVIGNVVAFFGNKIPKPAPPQFAFEPGRPFAAHVVVEFTPLAEQPPAPASPEHPEQQLFTLVVGRDGFRARPPETPASYLGTPEARSIELEFLRPKQALQRLPIGTAFRVLWGTSAVGKGMIVGSLQPAVGAPVDR